MIRTIAILAAKDLALFWRDRTCLFWAVAFPILVAILFGTIFAGRAPGALAIQLLDRGNETLARALAASPALAVARAESLEAGVAAVREGRAAALVVLQAGGATEIHAELSRRGEIEILRGLVAIAGQSQPPVSPVAGNPGRPRADRSHPFAAAMAWALIGAAAGFAVLLGRERRSGVLRRLRAAPLSLSEILLGKIAACFLAGVATLLVLALLAASFTGIHPAPGPGVPLAFAAAASCFTGLAILAGQFGRSEAETAAAVWGSMLAFALFGGAIMPFATLPEWMQALGHASPVRWAMLAFEGALWGGQEWRVQASFGPALTAVGIVAFIVGAGIFLRRAR